MDSLASYDDGYICIDKERPDEDEIYDLTDEEYDVEELIQDGKEQEETKGTDSA